MRIIVDINHPGHVHFFKNFIWEMKKRGHEVMVTASSKDVTFDLLENYDIDYINIGSYGQGKISKLINLFVLDLRMLLTAIKFKPDVILGIATIRGAHIGWLIRKPALVFTDTEHAKKQIALYLPFATKVYTPWCFTKNLGEKHIKYNGLQELAYLHPNWFIPDPTILKALQLKEGERFFVVRFVAWDATHDTGQQGFTDPGKRKIIELLERHGRVYITSEKPLPSEFEKYRLTAPPTEIHSLLYYAEILIGESGTMATEAGILGTPSVYVSTLFKHLGNFDILKTAEIVYSYDKETGGTLKLNELLKTPNMKSAFRERSRNFMGDKIDVTQFLIETVENSHV